MKLTSFKMSMNTVKPMIIVNADLKYIYVFRLHFILHLQSRDFTEVNALVRITTPERLGF